MILGNTVIMLPCENKAAIIAKHVCVLLRASQVMFYTTPNADFSIHVISNIFENKVCTYILSLMRNLHILTFLLGLLDNYAATSNDLQGTL